MGGVGSPGGGGGGGGAPPVEGWAAGAEDEPPGAPNETDGVPGAKLTWGGPASRRVSSTSKYCSTLKPKLPATTFEGNDWTRRLYSRTFAL